MLKTDKELKGKKVLIFSEFSDTAEYIGRELVSQGFEDLIVIDGTTSPDRRLDIIRQFAPYYNGSSSGELAATGQRELQIVISTDVLSEGLNLQDATRLINYDLHWNPVRLMQRIGRVDRRMNPRIEAALIADHPSLAKERGRIIYWNFLPPNDLDRLLELYKKVSKKTLRISKVLGIEGKQLLTPEDDYKALRDLNAKYDGQQTSIEKLRLEYQRIMKEEPGLAARLDELPGQIYSGRTFPEGQRLSARGLFFCYALPAFDADTPEQVSLFDRWTERAGETVWCLLDTSTGQIITDAPTVADFIRSTPKTPPSVEVTKSAFQDARKLVEAHIAKQYLRPRNAPAGVKGRLVAWMDLH
jgi:superfamily II DNA/RNA helicase